jgi:hypothetical protein
MNYPEPPTWLAVLISIAIGIALVPTLILFKQLINP